MSDQWLQVRPAAVAGSFYPADREELSAALNRAFAAAVPLPDDGYIPRALVVPHAGYRYSGAVAASAYLRLAALRGVTRRVVLLGPSHRVAVAALATSSADAFATPLGLIGIDKQARASVLELPQVVVNDAAHAQEHSLEVQLPFLQFVLDDFELLPLVVGGATDQEIVAVLDSWWDDPSTLIVVSTDLSHFYSHREAMVLDARTAAAIVALQPGKIEDHNACGAHGLRGLLDAAANRGLTVEQIDLRTSGDTAGDKNRVVGYGAFAVV